MKYKITFILINVLLVIVYAAELIIPYIFSGFIDSLIQYASMESVLESILIIVALTIVLMVSSYFHHILSELLITKASHELLNDMDEKLERVPIRKTEKYNPAYLNNRLFNDILTTVGFIINNLIVSIVMLLSTLVLFTLIIQIYPILVLIPIAAITINITGILILNKLFYKRGYAYKEKNNQYLSENNDRISHIKDTKVHAWYDVSGGPVNKSFKQVLKAGISLNKVLAALNNIGKFSKNLTLILTMIMGGVFVLNEQISIGQFILITYYTNMCLSYSEYFLKLGQEYQHAKISYNRLDELLDIENETNGMITVDDVQRIIIRDLSFAYPGTLPLFTNLNYTFLKGKIYCLIGKNGEGKSTVIDLLLGLDYEYKGSIQYNDIDISKLNMISIRKHHVSVILQEPRLQKSSVKENILRGLQEFSSESLNELTDKFGLNNVINLNESLSLSAGEKQKVAIVRGLLKSASVLILDEPVSAMDASSIKVLKEELLKRKVKTITILISHNEELFDIVDDFIELPKP